MTAKTTEHSPTMNEQNNPPIIYSNSWKSQAKTIWSLSKANHQTPTWQSWQLKPQNFLPQWMNKTTHQLSIQFKKIPSQNHMITQPGKTSNTYRAQNQNTYSKSTRPSFSTVSVQIKPGKQSTNINIISSSPKRDQNKREKKKKKKKHRDPPTRKTQLGFNG